MQPYAHCTVNRRGVIRCKSFRALAYWEAPALDCFDILTSRRILIVRLLAMSRWIIPLLVLASTFRLQAGEPASFILGSGEPGLGIIYESANEYVIFIDEGAEHSWKPGDYLDVDFRNEPLKIIAARNFGT